MALLAKVSWRLFNDRTSLWAQVLRCKYNVGDLQDLSWLASTGSWFSTMRSVGLGILEVIVKGYACVVGDGASTRFWTDKWLGNEALVDSVHGHLPDALMNIKANELWQADRGWNFDVIGQYVDEDKRLELRSVVLDTITGAKDKLVWGETRDGSFSVASAYALLTRENVLTQDMEQFYNCIWRLKVSWPKPIQTPKPIF